MRDDLACPRCTTDEHLRGEREGDVIRITCEQCSLSWTRDPSPRCELCGTHDDVLAIPTPIFQKARGTQLSIVGVRTVYRCDSCNRRHNAEAGYRQIPPDDNPAAGLR
jgi:transposase-like protein